MAPNPLISVVIPMYKVEEHIENTLLSLVNQAFRDFELILVDDGSPDRSAAVAENFLKAHALPYVIIHNENMGQGGARNSGYDLAKGEWVYFLDSDDVIQPFTFACFSRIAEEHPDAPLVFTRFQYVHGENWNKPSQENLSCRMISRDEMLHGFLCRSIVPLVPGTFYKRAFLVSSGVRHNHIRWSEDQFFMWHVLSHVPEALFWDCVTYNYFRHDGSVMSSAPTQRMIEAYGEFKKVAHVIGNAETQEFLLARWVLGCLHEVAARCSYGQWLEFGNTVDYRDHLKCLKKFPLWKVRALALVGILSPRGMYEFLRRG